jgi:ABC-type multidrug transport system fused ATPase/permease subunit
MASKPEEKLDIDPESSESDLSPYGGPSLGDVSGDDGDDNDENEKEKQQAPHPSARNDPNYPPIMAVDRAELTRVASEIRPSVPNTDQISSTRGMNGAAGQGGVESDSALDPTQPDFDIYKWAKYVLRAAEDAKVKFRRASFTFENLSVSGSGLAVHLQPTVASVLLAPIRLPEWVSMARKPQRTILTGFDGVVKPGEMLLVLGRPGSGCSTLLKSIAGELQGFKVGPGSVIHYSGIFYTIFWF